MLWFALVALNTYDPVPIEVPGAFFILQARTPVRHNPIVVNNNGFEAVQTHANDSQNVHDKQVLTCLKKKFKRLVHLYSVDNKITDIDSKLPEFYEEIEAAIPAQHKKNVKTVLTQVKAGAQTSSIPDEIVEIDDKAITVPAKENYILYLIWNRIKSPDNDKNRDDLIEMLFNQLNDCIMPASTRIPIIEDLLTPGGMHCINGRIGRMISTLTLLDNDPVLQEPEKDIAEIRNIMFMRAAAIRNQELAAMEIKQPGFKEKYDADDTLEFDIQVRNKISTTLLDEFKGQVPTKDMREIINDACL